MIGRPEVASRSDIVRYAAGGIIDVVAVRKVDDLFAKERLLVERQHRFIGDHVIDVLGAGRPRISQIVDLNGRRTAGQNAGPVAFG